MKCAPWVVVGLGFVLVRCGGIARIGTTGEQRGSGASGGTSADSGNAGGSGVDTGGRTEGTGGRPHPVTGGQRNSGGRSSGGQSSGGSGALDGHGATGGGAFGGGGAGGSSTGGAPFDAGSEPDRNRVPAGQVCDRLTTIQCAGEQHCCPRARSFDACKQAMANTCASIYLDAMSSNPTVGYDIDRAEAAFTEFEKRASTCDLTIVDWALSDAGFRGVARGTIPPGAPCLTVDGGAPFDALARIVSCDNPETYACLGFPGGSPWRCMPRGTTSSPCFTDMNCADGFFCDYSAGPNPLAQCAEKKPNGASCLTLFDCESVTCTNGVCGEPTAETAYCLPY